jgi:hypothetical protein
MVSPRQAPSPRVVPRMNPVPVAPPRVNLTLPRNSVIPLTPHPASANAPYVPQGMVGVNLFDTFEDEHMYTRSLHRYNTRARAHQHSANQAQLLAPRFLRPIKPSSHQVSGAMLLAPSSSPLMWMVLVYNMWEKNMPSISLMH